MRPKSARFITSAADSSGFPPPSLPEVAFAGRSNVGKSTLINTLVGSPKLARTSNTPGRTRLLNWFQVEPQVGREFLLVDLPGFGYARVPQEMRDSWRPMVESFLTQRDTLKLVMVLVDARRGAQEEEHELLEWLVEEGLAACVVLTKLDKLPKAKRKLAAMEVKKQMALTRAPIATSSETKEGLAELWKVIHSVM